MSSITDALGTEDRVTDVSCSRRINWDDFGVVGDTVVLYAALLNTVKSGGQPVDFTCKTIPSPSNV